MDGPQTRALADHLNDFLTGKPVEQILVPEHRWQANVLLLNCVGQVIQRIRSHGSWLFFDFSHGVTWVCQLITRSKWAILSPDAAERLTENGSTPELVIGMRRKRRLPLITLIMRSNSTGAPIVAALTGRPIFYILQTNKVWSHPDIHAIGPDPLATATFHDDFPYRLRQQPQRTVASALLDQEIVAGLGNVLKCEILFTTRFAPSVKIGALLASQIEYLTSSIVGLVATAATFASKGEPFPRRVYDRAGLPCTACGTEIVVDRSGQDSHHTWYCPKCQPIGTEPTLFTP